MENILPRIRKDKTFHVMYERRGGEPVASLNTMALDFAMDRLRELQEFGKTNPTVICESLDENNRIVREQVSPENYEEFI